MVQTAPVVTVTLLFGPRNTVSVPGRWPQEWPMLSLKHSSHSVRASVGMMLRRGRGGGRGGGGGVAAFKQRLFIAVGESLWT